MMDFHVRLSSTLNDFFVGDFYEMGEEHTIFIWSRVTQQKEHEK